MSATAIVSRTPQKSSFSLSSFKDVESGLSSIATAVSAFAKDPQRATADMLGVALAGGSGDVVAGTRLVDGMFSLKDRAFLPNDREEALHDLISKCKEMRKKELGGAQEIAVPRPVPAPLPLDYFPHCQSQPPQQEVMKRRKFLDRLWKSNKNSQRGNLKPSYDERSAFQQRF
jgi:hypothetical protein